MSTNAIVKELPVKLTEEEALRQILAENEANEGEELVHAQLTETPIERIPEIPRQEGGPVEFTEEEKAAIEGRLKAAHQEFHSMIQYLETKHGVKFIQQVGFQADLSKG